AKPPSCSAKAIQAERARRGRPDAPWGSLRRRFGLDHREAVEQAGSAGRHQVLLATAARGVAEVPEIDALRVADQVVVAEPRRARAVGRPVAARHVFAGREGGAVTLGA